MKSVSHIILGTLLASGAAIASDIDFDQHDKDADGFLSQKEWRGIDQAVTDFEQADSNRDGRLDRDEASFATQQSMEVSATRESDGGGNEIEASVYSDSGQQMETGRSDEQDSDKQAEAELASSEPASADNTSADEVDQQASAELATGDQGEIQRVSDEPVDEREPVRSEPLMQSETEQTSTEQSAEAELAAQQAGGEDQSGEEFREQLGQDDDQDNLASTDAMSDMPPQAEVAPVRAGFDASGEGKQVFEEADTDGDSRLSESEARLAGHDYVAIYFDQMDVDRDGYLHEEEWDLTQREGMETQNVSSEEGIESMRGDDGEDLRSEGISHERAGEDEEPAEEEETDFEQ